MSEVSTIHDVLQAQKRIEKALADGVRGAFALTVATMRADLLGRARSAALVVLTRACRCQKMLSTI